MKLIPRLVALVAALAVIVTACGGSPAVESTPTAPAATDVTTTLAPQASPAETAESSDGLSQPASDMDARGEVDLVTYVAAIEDALAGTAYAGQALEAPEVFLATGALFCEQLDDGMTPDEVLVAYVETLTGGSVDDAPDEELAMAGGILGVGVVTLCPAHLDTVGAST